LKKKEKTQQEVQAALLEVFENPAPQRDYRIVHSCHEFTSVCPKTGQPDFATVTIDYVPDSTCLELKALKFYFQEFRNQGIFYEAVINRILEDLVAACAPRSLTVTGNFNVRGGFTSVVTAEYRKAQGVKELGG
jgi:7-cyano-7-deazaguanine reductase